MFTMVPGTQYRIIAVIASPRPPAPGIISRFYEAASLQNQGEIQQW
jgi:hypothetical protein